MLCKNKRVSELMFFFYKKWKWQEAVRVHFDFRHSSGWKVSQVGNVLFLLRTSTLKHREIIVTIVHCTMYSAYYDNTVKPTRVYCIPLISTSVKCTSVINWTWQLYSKPDKYRWQKSVAVVLLRCGCLFRTPSNEAFIWVYAIKSASNRFSKIIKISHRLLHL